MSRFDKMLMHLYILFEFLELSAFITIIRRRDHEIQRIEPRWIGKQQRLSKAPLLSPAEALEQLTNTSLNGDIVTCSTCESMNFKYGKLVAYLVKHNLNNDEDPFILHLIRIPGNTNSVGNLGKSFVSQYGPKAQTFVAPRLPGIRDTETLNFLEGKIVSLCSKGNKSNELQQVGKLEGLEWIPIRGHAKLYGYMKVLSYTLVFSTKE